jgi:membrane-bound serine protease (ClpP class)
MGPEKIGKRVGGYHRHAMMIFAASPEEVSLILPIGLLVAGLVLIGAEFFLPTVFLGFLGAIVSFAGIYLSAEAGAMTCGVFCVVFLVVLALEFLAFRRLLPQTAIGRSMINVSSNEGTAVPAAAGYAVYVGKNGKAVTVLAPSGTIEIDGTLIEAFSLDGFVERNAGVVVTEAGSGRVTVRRSR